MFSAPYPFAFALAWLATTAAWAAPPVDIQADTWTAADALGRSLPIAPRAPRAGRYVGVFYFMVHGTRRAHDSAVGNYDRATNILDNSVILQKLAGNLGPQFPQYLAAYRTPGNYWWGEPAVGYFLSDDEWVHRKNLIMLADAGVDVIFLDATNAVLYPDAEDALFRAAEDLQRAGMRVPKIGYVLHTHMADTAERIYSRFYAGDRYKNFWFDWLGKPLLLANADAVMGKEKKPIPQKIRDFFTWRESWAWTPRPARAANWFGNGHDKWPWIDDYPQGFGWHETRSQPEEVAVSIAGHPVDDLGRSFRGAWHAGGIEPSLNVDRVAADVSRGNYFRQQWNRAIDLDPQLVFVTGWNEWYARRFPQNPPYPVGDAGDHLPNYFVDEYNPEFSRDAMPMKGGFEDNYYMQLVDGIRRFKGSRTPPTAKGPRSIDPNAGFSQWGSVGPDFYNTLGDAGARNWPGWGKLSYYAAAKRNEIVLTKVACDARTIAFYIKNKSEITAPTPTGWMQLLIDTDRNPTTGWRGYDFVINRHRSSAQQASVECWTGNNWNSVGTAALTVSGNEMMIVVPRSMLRLPTGQSVSVDFHWLDDIELPANPADFWYRGGNAPDGRFNYRYNNLASVRKAESD